MSRNKYVHNHSSVVQNVMSPGCTWVQSHHEKGYLNGCPCVSIITSPAVNFLAESSLHVCSILSLSNHPTWGTAKSFFFILSDALSKKANPSAMLPGFTLCVRRCLHLTMYEVSLTQWLTVKMVAGRGLVYKIWVTSIFQQGPCSLLSGLPNSILHILCVLPPGGSQDGFF